MFSICIPAFKVKYLAQAIQSVLKQTFEDFELIIVNDKSPEDVQSVVRSFNDTRIHYFENEVNIGGKSLVKNWQKCLSYATRPYGIMFSDDDFLDEAFLSTMADLIHKYPDVKVFYSRVIIVDPKDQLIEIAPSAPEFETCIDFIWHRVKGYREIYAPNFVFDIKALNDLGGFIDFPAAWGSDDATWFSLAKSNGIVSTNKMLCSWRWSGINISNVGDFNVKIGAIQTYYAWLKNFVEAYVANERNSQQLKESILKSMDKWNSKSKTFLVERLFINKPLYTALKSFSNARHTYNLNYSMMLVALAKKYVGKSQFDKQMD